MLRGMANVIPTRLVSIRATSDFGNFLERSSFKGVSPIARKMAHRIGLRNGLNV